MYSINMIFSFQVSDLSEVQIDLILKEISNTLLIVLPDGPMKVENILTCNEVCATLQLWTWILEHYRNNALVH